MSEAARFSQPAVMKKVLLVPSNHTARTQQSTAGGESSACTTHWSAQGQTQYDHNVHHWEHDVFSCFMSTLLDLKLFLSGCHSKPWHTPAVSFSSVLCKHPVTLNSNTYTTGACFSMPTSLLFALFVYVVFVLGGTRRRCSRTAVSNSHFMVLSLSTPAVKSSLLWFPFRVPLLPQSSPPIGGSARLLRKLFHGETLSKHLVPLHDLVEMAPLN